MKCSVYIHETKITECDLAPSDASMGVAHSKIHTGDDAQGFANLLIKNGAQKTDGILDLLKTHGLRVLDDRENPIPSVGSSLMFCQEINQAELDVYGIDHEYYRKHFPIV